MSHFTVLVNVPEGEELDAVMLPYHEYECTGIEEYTELVDDFHDDDLEEYQTKTATHVFKGEVDLGHKYTKTPEIEAMWYPDEDDNQPLQGKEIPPRRRL